MIEFLRLYLLLWAMFPLPPAAPPEAEAVRDVLGDRGEEKDVVSRHWHDTDTQPTTCRWLVAGNGKSFL